MKKRKEAQEQKFDELLMNLSNLCSELRRLIDTIKSSVPSPSVTPQITVHYPGGSRPVGVSGRARMGIH